LAVTPFENRSLDSADVYLAATLTEDVTSALAASHAVRLLGASGRGAAYRLTGSVRRENGVERVSARVERVAGGEILWTGTLFGGRSEAPLADQLAQQVLQRLGLRGAETAVGRGADRPIDPVTFDLYRRGRYLARRRTQADVTAGLDLLSRAVARDSSFALAWAEIATTYGYVLQWNIPLPAVPAESVLARELGASTRALLSDSTRSDIWVARATALIDVEPTSRVAAIRAYRRALAIDSLNADAWSRLGVALEEAGDPVEGARALKRSLALDPTSPVALVNYGLWHLYWNRQFDSAKVIADSALAVDPAYISGHRTAGTVALARGDYAGAEAQFETARNIGPGIERVWSLAGLAVAAIARGDSVRARALVTEMEGMTNAAAPSLHAAVFLAWGLTAIGEHSRALDWLERFHPAGSLHFQMHLKDGPLDPLRNEPRFRRLVGP
jgi:Tfp pilus assembly protein PilF